MKSRASGDPAGDLDRGETLDALNGSTGGLDGVEQVRRRRVRSFLALTAARTSGRQAFDRNENEGRFTGE